MIGARWIVVGAMLAGCVFTPRPMIPIGEDDADADPTNRGPDASATRDGGVTSDRGATGADVGSPHADTTPPEIEAGTGADVPAVATPDGGAPLDTGAFQDAPAFDAPAFDAVGDAPMDAPVDDAPMDAGADCAGADGGDGGACIDDAVATDGDAEVGVSGP